MKAQLSFNRLALLALAALLLVGAAGCASQSSTSGSSAVRGMSALAPAPEQAPNAATVPQDVAGSGSGTAGSAAKGTVVPTDRLVISTASMSIEVKNLDSGVSAVRALAAKYGATISDLSVSAGSEPPIVAQPLDTQSSDGSAITPGGATISLRVPAAKLPAAEKDAAALGRIISQTASESDVTQQHVDLAARLKNLRAEEARLRAFFTKATKVSEMLAIESELSRVRGDIESMQAQLTYLESQSALATLTISLREPGGIVSPAASGWGFAAAVRDGIRAAADVTRGLITFLLAFSPIILLGLVAFFAIRALVRRRRRRKLVDANGRLASSDPTQTPASTDQP